MHFVNCTYQDHAEAILSIYNDVILHSTALYDYKPRTMETMKTWFATKDSGEFPVIAAVNDAGELQGFASYGVFRPFPAYKYTIEHSVYVHRDHRRKGVARALLQRLVDIAKGQQYHTMIGAVDAKNTGSIMLHEQCRFTHSGTIRQAGFKFGEWLDVSFYQRLLETPENPVDDI